MIYIAYGCPWVYHQGKLSLPNKHVLAVLPAMDIGIIIWVPMPMPWLVNDKSKSPVQWQDLCSYKSKSLVQLWASGTGPKCKDVGGNYANRFKLSWPKLYIHNAFHWSFAVFAENTYFCLLSAYSDSVCTYVSSASTELLALLQSTPPLPSPCVRWVGLARTVHIHCTWRIFDDFPAKSTACIYIPIYTNLYTYTYKWGTRPIFSHLRK